MLSFCSLILAAGLVLGTPITPEQAQTIAEKATGGTAIEVEQETEEGVAVFEVEVRVPSDGSDQIKEVIIRASDGVILLIELEDDDDDHDEDDDDRGDAGVR
jgi:uncharacterized membrane protein YkoI